METNQPVDVLSFMDVLEHMPWPVGALAKAYSLVRPGGILALSMPNTQCSSWKAMDAARQNPYWIEIEHHHNFSRDLLYRLLDASGFEPVWYGVSLRYKAGMEVVAFRRPDYEASDPD